MNFLYVGLGGALGAISIYTIRLIPVKTQFPILTLVTNIIGAVIIGFIVGVSSSRRDISPNTLLFWKTGVCGGFTTFSTFSLEALNLIENKSYYYGGLYIALSLFCCILGVYWGKKISLIYSF